MKKFLYFAALAVAMAACMPTQLKSIISYIDYASITAESGVCFTESNSVSWDYQSLGSVYVRVVDGVEKVEIDVYDPNYGKTTETRKKKVSASAESALRFLAEVAKEEGADYVINLSVRPEHDSKSGEDYWVATGMAVKRR